MRIEISPPMSHPREKSILFLSEHLPYDVVYDILTLLPVKSLIRFRCVFKSWNSLITHPIFITTHFNLNLKKPKSFLSNNNAYLLYTQLPSHLCTVVCNSSDHRTLTEISRFQIPFSHFHIVGFCNGLFLLRKYHNTLLYLWNPSIRKFKMLPPHHLTDVFGRVALGLAYNSQNNNDFKILRLALVWEEEFTVAVEAEVYTLSTDSWRRVVIPVESEHDIGSINYIYRSSCLFFNGALHFIVASWVYYFILSFDVNDERFREIMLPPNYLDELGYSKHLVVIKGSLALIIFGKDDYYGITGVCKIWVMREYGVVESWTKTCVATDWVREFYGCIDNGELLIKTTRLVSFDPECLKENVLAIEDAKWVGYTANSMESLVLLDEISL